MVRFAAAALALAVTLNGVAAYGDVIELLDFWSPTCGPCMQMKPTVESLINARYPIRQVDVSRDTATARQFNVTGVPCFVMLVDGHEVDRVVGSTSSERLQQMFEHAKDEVYRQRGARPQSPDDMPTNGTYRPAPPATNDFHIVPVPGVQPQPPAPVAAGGSQFDNQLLSSSVRLTLDDDQTRSHGTGTIIDAREGDALIITCGHLFRDSKGKAPVTVELYVAGPDGLRVVESVPGQVVTYDLDRDVALVSIHPSHTVCVAPVAPPKTQVAHGDRAVSVGCNNGEDPTVMQTRVTRIDPYKGLPTIEASGEPVVGRSGGGLFNVRGELVGVCFAADREGNNGLYASLDSIHHELNRIGLRDIYAKAESGGTAGSDIGPIGNAPFANGPLARGQVDENSVVPASPVASESPADAAQKLNPAEQAALEEIVHRAAAHEVIFIIQSKEPGAQSEVIHFDNASDEFINVLQALRQKSDGSLTR